MGHWSRVPLRVSLQGSRRVLARVPLRILKGFFAGFLNDV